MKSNLYLIRSVQISYVQEMYKQITQGKLYNIINFPAVTLAGLIPHSVHVDWELQSGREQILGLLPGRSNLVKNLAGKS